MRGIASHGRNPLLLPIMCIVLHLRYPALAPELGLSGGFRAVWGRLARWRSSCISPDARCLGAQIGVSIVKLDARCHRHSSAGAARAEAQAQAFAAPSSDRAVPGFLWLDGPAGGGTRSDDCFAAFADHVSVQRQHGTEQSQRQAFSKATSPSPGWGRSSLPGANSVDPGHTGRQRPKQPQCRQAPQASPTKTTLGNCGYCGRTQDRENDLSFTARQSR